MSILIAEVNKNRVVVVLYAGAMVRIALFMKDPWLRFLALRDERGPA